MFCIFKFFLLKGAFLGGKISVLLELKIYEISGNTMK